MKYLFYAFIGAIVFAATALIYADTKLYHEFPLGTKVKYLDSDIVGTVDYTRFPMIKINYVDDFNVIQTAEINYRFVTKVK